MRCWISSAIDQVSPTHPQLRQKYPYQRPAFLKLETFDEIQVPSFSWLLNIIMYIFIYILNTVSLYLLPISTNNVFKFNGIVIHSYLYIIHIPTLIFMYIALDFHALRFRSGKGDEWQANILHYTKNMSLEGFNEKICKICELLVLRNFLTSMHFKRVSNPD